MLPDDAVNAFTLKEGQHCPAVSMYLEVAPDFTVLSHESRVEQVFVAANLRHDTLEPLFNEDTLANDPGVDYPYKAELRWLWEFANALEVRRGKADPTRPPQLDYNFAIEDGKVVLTRRRRGAPMDKLVSELMILVNCEWGGELARRRLSGDLPRADRGQGENGHHRPAARRPGRGAIRLVQLAAAPRGGLCQPAPAGGDDSRRTGRLPAWRRPAVRHPARL